MSKLIWKPRRNPCAAPTHHGYLRHDGKKQHHHRGMDRHRQHYSADDVYFHPSGAIFISDICANRANL